MKYTYPAYFYKEEDGRYSVIFPDLNDLATYGDDLADAFAMAQEACGQYLFNAMHDGEKVPTPTPMDKLKKDDEAEIVNMVFVDLDEFAREYGDKPVKKTLSIPAWLNSACEKQGVNFSKVLKDALISRLQMTAS